MHPNIKIPIGLIIGIAAVMLVIYAASIAFTKVTDEYKAENISSFGQELTNQYYYEADGAEQAFGEEINAEYLTNQEVYYREYEKAMILSSNYGVYSVRLPILNVYLSAGGVEAMGAPLGESYTKSGSLWQDFENGTLSYDLSEYKIADTLCIRRGNVYYFKNSIEGGEADTVITYGKSTDEVLVGDWNGDGIDTLCLRRGNVYYFKNSISDDEADTVITFGRKTDEVLVGDWNGDGIDTLCLRRRNVYYFKNSIAGGKADAVITYGKSTDEVLAGDWNGNGIDTLCLRRGNVYYFKNSIAGGEADEVIEYGNETDEVLVGDWNGDGVDTLSIRQGNVYYFKNSINGGEADKVIVYGKADDDVYTGIWKTIYKADKIEASSPTELSINSTQDFSYSRLTSGFAGNSVNSTSFRKSAVTTYVDTDGNEIQYCAYYDYYGTVVLAKRENSGSWIYRWTGLKGTISDAHNVISLAVDGQGYLHAAWSRHNGQLIYVKAESAGSLIVHEQNMIGSFEDSVTYPEFYVIPNGDIFFLYRNGSSGNGNVVLNKYDTSAEKWNRVQNNLISGEGERSAYWQACVDDKGRLHISWVWRETSDVLTNYNMCYAVSTDSDGMTFVNSAGKAQALPITEATADVICQIPQGSALINQTSMTTDDADCPYIISYWRTGGVVQYNILRYNGKLWTLYNTGLRSTDFVLSGGGTKQLPCARPQILADGYGEAAKIYVIFRDEERSSYASIAGFSIVGNKLVTDKITDITGTDMGEWEPNYDITLWKKKKKIQLFAQKEFYASDSSSVNTKMEYVYIIDVTSVKQ